jgi:hypothetical protein
MAIALSIVGTLLAGPALSQTNEPESLISGELTRLHFPRTINKFDLRGMGAAQDLVVQAFAENGFVSAPTFTMLLSIKIPNQGTITFLSICLPILSREMFSRPIHDP